ncbi:cytochrome P450 [Streptomyces spirodelae]|uniref:Cytochrome P450 n=1 Tax=Streptomyces spirodelae TaxID=2812904 RepID=A0ABS3WLN0_9ACTN|nr:cytochrome P450 [Streptomyces spirodelae]MBO8184021.1 cytochrome P450 [Streptomyces spirodelae]
MDHAPSTRSPHDAAHAVELVTRPDDSRTGCPFDPPAELTRHRQEQPLRRLRFPDGHLGWLATGYSVCRAILADARLSSRKELMHNPSMDLGGMEIPPAAPGEFINMDEPQHGRYRKLLAGKFTVRRMKLLTERVEQITAEHLDAMEKAGPTVDLVTAFAQPIPAIMICELLGVPYQDRDSFQEQAAAVFSGDMEEKMAAFTAIQTYLAELVAAKRADPTDDILSDLTDSDLTDEELLGIGFLLLAAGIDTTANMLGLGAFALLSDPEQAAVLRGDPSLAGQAVEELLRYLTIAELGLRTALEDVEIGGRTIKAGETVVVSFPAANRDPEKYPEPDRLDLRRQALGHLAFGHGAHQCVAQQLARVEMSVAFPALLARFPTLRPAIPREEVPLRVNTNVYGVESLPVTWDVTGGRRVVG